MQNLTKSLSYNIFTLKPRSESDRHAFWLFRCHDISKMVYVYIVFVCAWLLQYIATVIDKPSNHSLGQTLSMIGMIIMCVLIILAKRRSKANFPYLLLIVTALLQFFDVCGADVQLSASMNTA